MKRLPVHEWCETMRDEMDGGKWSLRLAECKHCKARKEVQRTYGKVTYRLYYARGTERASRMPSCTAKRTRERRKVLDKRSAAPGSRKCWLCGRRRPARNIRRSDYQRGRGINWECKAEESCQKASGE